MLLQATNALLGSSCSAAALQAILPGAAIGARHMLTASASMRAAARQGSTWHPCAAYDPPSTSDAYKQLALVRRFSSEPPPLSAAATAAASGRLMDTPAPARAAAAATVPAALLPLRVKGIGRKMLLRQVGGASCVAAPFDHLPAKIGP
jgi:hypothetical protein